MKSNAMKLGSHPHTPTIFFTSSNGVGLGHLARQMAIADRLPENFRSVFLTMSYACRIALEQQYLTFFLPHHFANDLDVNEWNDAFADELLLHVDSIQPQVLILDSTAVFHGVLKVIKERRAMKSVWLRRAMWREIHGRFLSHESRFDYIIEPGELAHELDHGPTRWAEARVIRVPPVLNVDPSARMDRAAARQALNLPNDVPVACIQLANDSPFDASPIHELIFEMLGDHSDLFVIEFRSPLLALPEGARSIHPRHRRLRHFPSYRYSNAWDFAISAAGYNSFHENVIGAVPTIFVPNEAPEMDLQLNRAKWAESNAVGLLYRRDQPIVRLREIVERLFDARERDTIIGNCSRIDWQNGATGIVKHLLTIAGGASP